MFIGGENRLSPAEKENPGIKLLVAQHGWQLEYREVFIRNPSNQKEEL